MIQGELQGDLGDYEEVLLQPGSGTLPTHIHVARTLSSVTMGRKVILQVMNTCPTPVKIYKGMKLGEATPRCSVLLIDEEDQTAPDHKWLLPEINLDFTDLTFTEKKQLLALLAEFADIFAPRGGCVGRTPTVKHKILTEGPPIRQPVRRLPEVLKSVLNGEVEKMLEQGVVRPSSSPWSSPIVMVRKKDGS